MTRKEAIAIARHINEDGGTTWEGVQDLAKAYLELAAPEWMNAPEGPGLHWIDCYGYCTLTTVAADSIVQGELSAWTHGLRQPVNSFKGAKWAKAQLPVGPYTDGVHNE